MTGGGSVQAAREKRVGDGDGVGLRGLSLGWLGGNRQNQQRVTRTPRY